MADHDLALANELDAKDELAEFRQHFDIADPDLLYLDGNSLGRLPRRSGDALARGISFEWGERLIRSWGERWFHLPQVIGDKIGCLAGAAPGQVVVSDSTSVNLFKLVIAGLELRPGRRRIVSDTFNFPSDLYILQGCIRLLGKGHSLHLVPSPDGIAIDTQAICQAIDDDTALVTLSHVAFKSGYLYDAAAITARAEQVGALVLWDLSHSIGAVPVELDAWGAHLAIGCTYKYLNGGPGSPAFLYVRRDLQENLSSPIWGWFGQRNPFAFELDYTPIAGVQRFLAGTPPVLSLLAMDHGVDLVQEAGIERLRGKSVQLGEFLIRLFDERLAPKGFSLGSPRSAGQRGSHVSIRHTAGYQINRALIEEMKVIPDFREPDNIRLGLAPLYTTFQEVWQAVQRIEEVLDQQKHLRYPPARQAVT